MLSNSELAYMREAIDDLLPDTCNILSVTETNNGMGGVVQTWGTATAGVICRVDVTNLRSGEQVTGGSLKPFQQTILSLPYNTVITTSNRVEHDGTTYNVSMVNTNQSWIAVKRAYLERV